MFTLFVYPHKYFLQLGLLAFKFKFATNLCEDAQAMLTAGANTSVAP